ncbi:MAG: dihydroneopterin triphosphate diphosphatase, partial [Pseudomonadota bacterium]|nr:dihydroneopterin triphosphate diphosphatase [Pseudomonadota bacterium]
MAHCSDKPPYKRPVSVLVVIFTARLDVLLLERADFPGFWQSVTGSQEPGETLEQTAIREVGEETGIEARLHELQDWKKENVYEIYPRWRHRYAPGVTHNTEHVFGLKLLSPVMVELAPREHRAYQWVPAIQARQLCYSPSNA